MNKEQLILKQISQRALKGGVPMIKEDSSKIYRESLKEVYEDKRLNDSQRAQVKKMMESERLNRTTERVDEKKAAEVDQTVTKEIRHAIAQGHLKDPTRSVDQFMQDKK